jgi:hypothetical protein
VSLTWCGANVGGKKKSDEEAKKEQTKGLTEKVNLCSQAEFVIKWGCNRPVSPF